jgi:hypothetical protein
MPAAIVEMKNVGSVEVTSIVNRELSDYACDPHEPGLADRSLITKAEAEEDLKVLRAQGKYKPIKV